jgi:hypothetical protein
MSLFLSLFFTPTQPMVGDMLTVCSGQTSISSGPDSAFKICLTKNRLRQLTVTLILVQKLSVMSIGIYAMDIQQTADGQDI